MNLYSYTRIQLITLRGIADMPKPNPLAQGLNQTRSAAARLPVADGSAPKLSAPGSRSGRVLVGAHFAAEEGTTIQALLAEGINMVFAKRGKPEIAGLPTIRSV